MTHSTKPATPTTPPTPAPPADDAARHNLFVARQPIFDRHRKVVAYELLFRAGTHNAFAHADGSQATRQTVNTTLNVMGLQRLVGSHRAFVNVTRDLLLSDFCHVLPADQTVIELLEDITIDDAVVDACKRLKKAGYTLALDDIVLQPKSYRLLEIADLVKVDLMTTSLAESRTLMAEFGRPGLSFLAEKVETHEQFQQSVQLGYRYFQGYFFCKPEILSDRVIPASKQHYLMLLNEVTRPVIDFVTLEQAIRLEPDLSVKLLRFINASSHGIGETVSSIRQALTLLGEKALRQWGSLVVMTALGEDKPVEVVRTCLVRARFCELIGKQLAVKQSQFDLFLLGMLSMLDALLDQPLGVVLGPLPVNRHIKSALLGDSTPLAKVLMLALARERGEWQRLTVLAKLLRVDEPAIAQAYVDAVAWTDATVSGTAAGATD
ncbi:MAG: EAL domain-containing protein [Phycisphaeraceae bacterium]